MAQERVWTPWSRGKSLGLAGNRTQVVQPVTRRHTDWAIRLLEISHVGLKTCRTAEERKLGNTERERESERRNMWPQHMFLFFRALYRPSRSRDSSARIAMGYGLDCLGSIPGSGNKILFTADFPDLPLIPPNLLPNGFSGHFLREQSSLGVKPNTRLHIVPRWGMTELYLHSHIRLLGMMFN
jgi:hypothetical protein